jgi:hypothetical protein
MEKQLLDLGLPTAFGKTAKRKKILFDDDGNKEQEQEFEVPIQKVLLDEQSDREQQQLIHEQSDSQVLYSESSEVDPLIAKYYAQRYRLFSRFDLGIQLDQESWFSVTPEKIAIHIASRLSHCNLILDAFSGAGGNSIQFALHSKRVIAIEIDRKRLQISRHNAQIYDVADKIDFIQGDSMVLMPLLKVDAIFLSPPWGGPKYSTESVFDMRRMGPYDGLEILDAALKVTQNVAYMAPRNADPLQIVAHLGPGKFEAEKNIMNGKVKTQTFYFGNLRSMQRSKINSK